MLKITAKNKLLLQEFTRRHMEQELVEFCIVLSGGFDIEDQLTPAHLRYKNGRGHQVLDKTFDYEETDWRVILHLH